jgi:hypothetical protein
MQLAAHESELVRGFIKGPGREETELIHTERLKNADIYEDSHSKVNLRNLI